MLFTFSVAVLADQLFAQQLAVGQVLLLALWSFTPHLLGVFILVPYTGGFFSLCLAAWSFAVMVTGIYTVSSLSLTQATLCLSLGWVLWQLARRSVGWPVTDVARWLRARAAGEPLVTDRKASSTFFTQKRRALLLKLRRRGYGDGRSMRRAHGALAATAPERRASTPRDARLVGPVGLAWLPENVLHPKHRRRRSPTRTKVPSHYLVFLPGIDSVSEESYASDEVVFLERFRAKLPDTELVELFPYSVTNRALTGQRLFGRVWRWIVARRIAGRSVIGFLINVRNPWQVVVSADKRYGPISRYHLVCTTPGQRSAV